MTRRRTLAIHLAVAAAVVAADLWTKSAVFRFLGAEIIPSREGLPTLRAGPEHVVFPGFALEAALNPGAFNGMLAGASWLLLAISVVAAIGTLVIALVPPRMPVPVTVALGLIAGGALGNLYDRLQFGVVRDFVKWHYGERVWPNFNIADSGIVVGVALILFLELRNARRAKRAAREESAAAPVPAPEGAERAAE